RVLGTLFMPDGTKARALGWGLNVVHGALFAVGYQQALRCTGMFAGAPSGALLGVAHGLASMGAVAAMPKMHPRPRQAGLEKMGPSAHGPLTVPGMLLGHMLFGALVGAAIGWERHKSVVSPAFLRWIKRQEEEERASLVGPAGFAAAAGVPAGAPAGMGDVNGPRPIDLWRALPRMVEERIELPRAA
ncbi:MAG TPA: hypothetical protein VNM48_00615, partial [Chloroflexota bacterium]|nr:hypothetical protein [Chloroflexota bacterium]